MATKAEWFRYLAERSGPKREKRVERPRRPLEEETGTAASRNLSDRADRKAVYVLEDARPGARPSRKSTRASSNRQKNDVHFRLKRKVSEGRPEARAAMVPRGRGSTR